MLWFVYGRACVCIQKSMRLVNRTASLPKMLSPVPNRLSWRACDTYYYSCSYIKQCTKTSALNQRTKRLTSAEKTCDNMARSSSSPDAQAGVGPGNVNPCLKCSPNTWPAESSLCLDAAEGLSLGGTSMGAVLVT